MDRVVTRTDPLQRQEFYQYDLTGNLTQFTDRRGIATTFQYDTLYRPTSVSFETESSITYTHDGYDRLLDVADTVAGTNLCPAVLAGASICRSYNDLLRTSSETTPQGSISYAFDYAGRRKRMTVAGQPDVNYTFDLANRLTQISQGSANTIISYDQESRRTSLTLPNNVVTTYCYDNNSRLTGLFYGQATLCSNPSGTLGTLLYGYDALNRRNQVWGTFARTGLPQPVGSASYDAANGLLQWNGQLFSYDLNGNMTSDGTNTFTWDARNQLSQFNTTTFQYDADRRRTTNAAGTSFLYDVYNSVQELSGTTVTANRITGGADEYFSRADSTGSYAPLTDALGSTIALVNSSGNIVTQYTYDPFGNTTVSGSANGNVFQFTGRENDGNGLYYYRARYYSPQLGRFISQDPLRFMSGDTNLYRYVFNNPLSLIDPSGLATVVNNSGSPVVVRGNPGRGHGEGNQQVFGVVPPDGKTHGGPDDPIDGYATVQDAIDAFYHSKNPAPKPVGQIYDVDFYAAKPLAPGAKASDFKCTGKIYGDELGPNYTLTKNPKTKQIVDTLDSVWDFMKAARRRIDELRNERKKRWWFEDWSDLQ